MTHELSESNLKLIDPDSRFKESGYEGTQRTSTPTNMPL